jgi:hypothetical protein
VWLTIALVLLARLFGALSPTMWAWGLDAPRFLPAPLAWIGLAVMIASMVPAVARRVAGWIEPIGDALALGGWGARALAAIVVAVVVIALPDRTWFIGDFLIRMGSLATGSLRGSYAASMPLDTFLHGTLPRALTEAGFLSGGAFSRLLGAFEAGALALLAVTLTRTLRLRGAAAVAVVTVLVFGGHLLVFTGLPKASEEMCVLTAAIGVAGIRAVRERKGLLLMSVALATAFFVHRTAFLLVPAWAVAAIACARDPRWRSAHSPIHRWAAWAIPIAAVAVAAPRVVSLIRDYDLGRRVASSAVIRHGGPLATALSPAHQLDVVNLVMVLCPLLLTAVALLAIMRPSAAREPDAGVPLALALSFASILPFVRPLEGMFRDGDAFAAAGAALCLLSAWAIGQAFARGALARWLAVTIMAAVLVPALHWMAHFNQTARGLERIEAYLAEPPKPPEDVCAMTWNFLGERYARMDRWPDAARAQAEAARLAPHRRIFLQWGIAATTAGDFRAAQRAYRELLARDDADPLAWLGLAGVSIRLGDRDEATRALDRLRGFAGDPNATAQIRRHVREFRVVWPGPLELPADSSRASPR